MWIAASIDRAALAKNYGKNRPAQRRGAGAIGPRASAIAPGQTIANRAEAALHKAWNPIRAGAFRGLSTGGVDSGRGWRWGECEKNAKKARPRVRDAASMAIGSRENAPGQKIAKLAEAAPHKAWNPIPARVSQCLSTGGVDSR